jgi:hypothetical protein
MAAIEEERDEPCTRCGALVIDLISQDLTRKWPGEPERVRSVHAADRSRADEHCTRT